MFSVGDRVCYPMHGVGVVEAIEKRNMLGEDTEYYVLRFTMGHMQALVPVLSAQNVGLRALADEQTCERVVGILKEEGCVSESDNWNQRYRENLDKLRRGDIFVTAEVLKCLIHRDRVKGLSAGERKMYLTARQVLVAELAAASGKEESDFLPLVGG